MNSWFGLIKIMARAEVEPDLDIDEDLFMGFGDDDGDDNDCQCQADNACQNKATFKNPKTDSQVCGFHLNDLIDRFAGNHGFARWDCEKGEYLW